MSCVECLCEKRRFRGVSKAGCKRSQLGDNFWVLATRADYLIMVNSSGVTNFRRSSDAWRRTPTYAQLSAFVAALL